MLSGPYRMDDHFSVKVINDLSELPSLRQDWNSLASKFRRYRPWLCFEWFELCMKFSEKTEEPLILIIFKDGKIDSIAPFWVKVEKYKGAAKVRKIELIGNAQSAIRMCIFGSDNEEDLRERTTAIFKFLKSTYRKWDIIELDRIPTENGVYDCFLKSLGDIGLPWRGYFCEGSWYLDSIDYSFDEYYRRLPQKIRKDIEYCNRRLKRDGETRFSIVRDKGKVEEYTTYYYKVREKSWKAPEKGKEFIVDFARKCAEAGWLRMAALFFRGTPIAAQRWLVLDGTAFVWSILHDEEYKKYSPGKVLTAHILDSVMSEHKISEIDFMGGDDPYKRDWAPKRRERKGITVFNSNLKGGLFRFASTHGLPVYRRLLGSGLRWRPSLRR
jgi:hypothetical protein